MCKLQTYLLQIQFPSSQLIVVLRCVFIRHIRRPEPLLVMLIVAWSTTNGFEEPQLKVIVCLHSSPPSSLPCPSSTPLIVMFPHSSIVSITNRIKSRSNEEVDCCIYPLNLPSHLASKHIISNDHHPRLSLSQGCLLTPQSYRQQRRWRRQKECVLGAIWPQIAAAGRSNWNNYN
jgi:hypothetical protein